MADFVLDAIFPLKCFSNMAVMDEIVSQRVKFFCALFVFVQERYFFLSSNLTSKMILSIRLLG